MCGLLKFNVFKINDTCGLINVGPIYVYSDLQSTYSVKSNVAVQLLLFRTIQFILTKVLIDIFFQLANVNGLFQIELNQVHEMQGVSINVLGVLESLKDNYQKIPTENHLKLHGSIVGTAFNYLTSYKNHFRSTILSDLKSILTSYIYPCANQKKKYQQIFTKNFYFLFTSLCYKGYQKLD